MKRCRSAGEACVNVIVYQSESQRELQLAKYLTLALLGFYSRIAEAVSTAR